MGISVHKMVGYGLTDLATDDPRINPKGILGENAWEDDAYEDKEKFLQWCEENGDEKSRLDVSLTRALDRESENSRRLKDTPKDCFEFCGEPSVSKYLTIRPLGYVHWDRCGDTLDWCEETRNDLDVENPQKDWCRVLEDGIYPFNGLFMNAKTGDKLPDRVMHYRRLWWYRDKPEIQSELANLAFELGFDNYEDALKSLVPEIPSSIRDLCLWGNAFTNSRTILELRPMVRCWWI